MMTPNQIHALDERLQIHALDERLRRMEGMLSMLVEAAANAELLEEAEERARTAYRKGYHAGYQVGRKRGLRAGSGGDGHDV